mmetsp:Transcript_23193/g.48260  ORF Transcript_23193/g.48260 Transcript_23193/m.48260 type:complete len:459 (-) Transcript_23193:93-1469(-)
MNHLFPQYEDISWSFQAMPFLVGQRALSLSESHGDPEEMDSSFEEDEQEDGNDEQIVRVSLIVALFCLSVAICASCFLLKVLWSCLLQEPKMEEPSVVEIVHPLARPPRDHPLPPPPRTSRRKNNTTHHNKKSQSQSSNTETKQQKKLHSTRQVLPACEDYVVSNDSQAEESEQDTMEHGIKMEPSLSNESSLGWSSDTETVPIIDVDNPPAFHKLSAHSNTTSSGTAVADTSRNNSQPPPTTAVPATTAKLKQTKKKKKSHRASASIPTKKTTSKQGIPKRKQNPSASSVLEQRQPAKKPPVVDKIFDLYHELQEKHRLLSSMSCDTQDTADLSINAVVDVDMPEQQQEEDMISVCSAMTAPHSNVTQQEEERGHSDGGQRQYYKKSELGKVPEISVLLLPTTNSSSLLAQRLSAKTSCDAAGLNPTSLSTPRRHKKKKKHVHKKHSHTRASPQQQQ